MGVALSVPLTLSPSKGGTDFFSSLLASMGRRIALGLLALGAILVVAEGTIIGLRYILLNPAAPRLFGLMPPGMFAGLALVLAAIVWGRKRGAPGLPDGGNAPLSPSESPAR